MIYDGPAQVPGDKQDQESEDLIARRSSCVTTFVRWLRDCRVTQERLETALDLPMFNGANDLLKAAWAEMFSAAVLIINGQQEAWPLVVGVGLEVSIQSKHWDHTVWTKKKRDFQFPGPNFNVQIEMHPKPEVLFF